MNDGENDKVISWRKANNDNKPTKLNNNVKSLSKEYSKKEKEYLNKYLSISKNFLSEEKLYNIIIKFDFNDQLILSEIFQLLEEASENEKDENKINNIIENKSVFVPYKTHFGITKSIYNLKSEQKPKRKILSKDKIIYKYENNKKINSENNLEESINKDDITNNGIIYQKRFSNFNKIIEDYKNKKYKEENNYFFYKKNKNSYKNKYLGDKYNYNNQNNNKIISHKYYNSKKTKSENYDEIKNCNILIKKDNDNKNKEIIPQKKQNCFIKENVINFEYNKPKLNLNEEKKNSSFLISNKSQLIIKASYTKPKNDAIIKENNLKINENKNKKEENLEPKINFFEDDDSCIKENILKPIDNNNKYKNFKENNNIINNKYMMVKKDDNNKNIKMIASNIDNNNIANFNVLNSYSNMNLNNYYQYNNSNSNYLGNNKNFMLNIANNYNITKNGNFNNYNGVNINNNIHSINNNNNNNNFLLNNKIGIPFYFYPYYLKSNTNIMMTKYINMNSNINNNVFINSFYNPQMIRMYYQGFNNFNINNEKAKYFNNLNNSIMTPINPNIYSLLMNKIGIKFIPTPNFKRTTR